MIPVPTPEQAVHVLEILGEWTERGWSYRCLIVAAGVRVEFSDPVSFGFLHHSVGINHFDALCQATTVMQVLLEEHPEKI